MTTGPVPGRRLTEAERAAALARLREFAARVDAVPEEERTPVRHPGKYEGPIGADATGEVRTYDSVDDLPGDPP